MAFPYRYDFKCTVFFLVEFRAITYIVIKYIKYENVRLPNRESFKILFHMFVVIIIIKYGYSSNVQLKM